MGVEILKKTNFTITIRYKIPSFSSVGPFFEEGRGSRKFRPEAEILGIFSIEVAPYRNGYFSKQQNETSYFCGMTLECTSNRL